jgi:predicted nuclease of predicted toxin-antitoxin system
VSGALLPRLRKASVDQNLSHHLCRRLADVFPAAEQVKNAGLHRASDDTIWEYARRQDFAIVTLDSDFADIAALREAPPKIIWLRCGNQPTGTIERLLRDTAALIASFDDDIDAACLELY